MISQKGNTILEDFKGVFKGPTERPHKHITIFPDDAIKSNVHLPRWIPVILRHKIKEQPKELVQRKIKTPVTKST